MPSSCLCSQSHSILSYFSIRSFCDQIFSGIFYTVHSLNSRARFFVFSRTFTYPPALISDAPPHCRRPSVSTLHYALRKLTGISQGLGFQIGAFFLVCLFCLIGGRLRLLRDVTPFCCHNRRSYPSYPRYLPPCILQHSLWFGLYLDLVILPHPCTMSDSNKIVIPTQCLVYIQSDYAAVLVSRDMDLVT